MQRLGILGPRGTHSEAAALKLNEFLSKKFEPVIYPEIFEILRRQIGRRLCSGGKFA